MAWYWIALIVYVGCVLINPILYFIKWELYDRRKWIQGKQDFHGDERFWKHETYWYEDPDGMSKQGIKYVQIAPIRPQIKDIYEWFDNYWLWYFPLINIFYSIVIVGQIVARPFECGWKYIIRKIANIKV